jgi:hypothetical protein
MKKKFTKLLGIGLTVALLTSLFTVAGPAMALTQPQVSIPFGANVIGNQTAYTISFTTGKAVAAPNQIVIVFPAGVNITPGSPPTPLGVADVTLEALTGLGGNAFGPGVNPKAVDVTGLYPNPQTMVITLDDTSVPVQNLGAGALIGITINGVVNPTSPGDYTLTVATRKAATLAPIEAAVTSAEFSIITPILVPLPGIVTGYNSAGHMMWQSNSINACIDKAGVGGRIEVGPGTYDEYVQCDVARQTIVGTGDPGTVIITDADMDGLDELNGLPGGGTVEISAPGSAIFKTGVTLENLTISPNMFVPGAIMVTITGAASYATLKDCTIGSGTTAAVDIETPTTAGTRHAITDCTITAQHATATRIGVRTDGQVAISGTTIGVGAVKTSQAIQITDSTGNTSALYPTSVTNCTITGSSGLGIMIGSGTVTVKDSTLSVLTNAVDIDGGTVKLDGNTIDGCGDWLVLTGDAITIDGAGTTVNLYNNTISNTNAFKYPST